MTALALVTECESIPFLDDRYVLGEILGEGSVGTVYAAYDLVAGIEVAVKVMHERHARSSYMLARFSDEARISARMLSPHVVKVHGLAVTHNGVPCIVYERLIGETLAERIARKGMLTLAETANIVKQLARALARAHSLGVVHRDVKPDNIFLVEQVGGRSLVKLLDFGIAAVAQRPGGSVSRELVGTPQYIAPEVLFDTHAPDARADLYALGVVAFECLTGECPLPGGHFDDVLIAAKQDKRSSLLHLRPELRVEIDAWMDRALQPDPFWRFSSAKELSDALDESMQASRPPLRRAA